MKKAVFIGSAVAIVTPFNEKGQINFRSFERLIEFQIKNGTDAIVVSGTTGEAPVLSEREYKKLLRTAVESVNGHIPIIAGASSNNTAHAIKLSKIAKSAGADAQLQVTPYYNKPSQSGLVRHFSAIADATDLPVILYNVPSRTGVTVQPETYLELSKHQNIVAVKEASGDAAVAVKTAALCGDDLFIYSGDDKVTVPLLSIGAKGVISVVANILPKQTHDMCKLFFDGFVKESAEIQKELSEITYALFSETNPAPVKKALNMMGFDVGLPRLPLSDISDYSLETLSRALKKHGLIE